MWNEISVKLVTKLILALLLIGLFLPMWLKGPSGQPLMTPADWARLPERLGEVIDSLGTLIDRLPGQGASGITVQGDGTPASSNAAEYYRWQDEQGVWHFSDQPPPDSAAELVAEQLPEVQNSMEGFESEPTAGTLPTMDSSITPPLPEGVSKEAIEQLLQDAHERRMGEHL